ncbi:MAG TPA: GNAT family N-acetyltransferase [Candidatus Faecousia intestinigallinarum]|nr:GNAT family N-acetyltransferase [Candidatus Faecousia intestinigallinarum]
MEISWENGWELDVDQVLTLYKSVGWTAYTHRPEALKAGLARSLAVVTARRDGELIGLARAVGDETTILYIQDVLVRPEYQRRGVGGALLNELLSRYPQVRQKVLLTDRTPETAAFYRKLGFVPAEDAGCMAFTKQN